MVVNIITIEKGRFDDRFLCPYTINSDPRLFMFKRVLKCVGLYGS